MDRRVLATTLLALGGGPLGLFLNRFPHGRGNPLFQGPGQARGHEIFQECNEKRGLRLAGFVQGNPVLLRSVVSFDLFLRNWIHYRGEGEVSDMMTLTNLP